MSVVLVDAGGSNIGSVQAALARLGVAAELTQDPARIAAASHVILPGVGAAAPGMQRLRAANLVEPLRALRQPVLGVCLGMQLLFERSEESDTGCLGVIPGTVARIAAAPGMRVPHMGWNALQLQRPHALLGDLGANAYAYFVHSYAAPVGAATLASCEHGAAFSAIVQHRNFHGMQFHPERSSALGARLLRNFLAL